MFIDSQFFSRYMFDLFWKICNCNYSRFYFSVYIQNIGSLFIISNGNNIGTRRQIITEISVINRFINTLEYVMCLVDWKQHRNCNNAANDIINWIGIQTKLRREIESSNVNGKQIRWLEPSNYWNELFRYLNVSNTIKEQFYQRYGIKTCVLSKS